MKHDLVHSKSCNEVPSAKNTPTHHKTVNCAVMYFPEKDMWAENKHTCCTRSN